MNGIVGVCMTDFKFWDRAASKRFIIAEDDSDVARERIREMHAQIGDLTFDEEGLALREVLLRHLVMPNRLAGRAKNMRFVGREVSAHTSATAMAQYHPAGRVVRMPDGYADISRRIESSEYRETLQAACEEGLYRFAEL